MALEFKITQEAMDRLKRDYNLIKVDDVVMGLCHKSKLSSLTKGKCSDPKQYQRAFRFFILKGSENNFFDDFGICVYGAKSDEKVHVGFTSFIGDGGIVSGIPDDRSVLMTKEESKKFESIAKNHKMSMPDNYWIDSKSNEMRQVIPKGKIKLPSGRVIKFDPKNQKGDYDILIANGLTAIEIS